MPAEREVATSRVIGPRLATRIGGWANANTLDKTARKEDS
jgi:hypothetical protein